MKEGVNMTQQEVSRADVLLDICQGKITTTRAAEMLNMSVRHVRRLHASILEHGIIVLISKQRGKPSNHRLPSFLKARVLEIVTSEIYAGFGPTLMCEKLEKLHSIKISRETTRYLMVQSGVWETNKKRRPVIHQQRQRRARCGELLQLDGSPHHWFEDRGEPCCLIVLIDDATGLTYAKFFKSETTKAYMEVVMEYITFYGRPLAFYPDQFSVFRINKPGCLKRDLVTQFGRACKELGIELICANSPQAKGRVERVNQTLQDRLVKEMRLAGISTIKEGNRFLPHFLKEFNQQFMVQPRDQNDAHRALLPEQNLKRILCIKSQRKVTKNLEVQYNNEVYQIILEKPSRSLIKAEVTMLEGLDGQVSIEHQGKPLPFKLFSQQEANGEVVHSKEIDRFVNKINHHKKPSTNHPWIQEGRVEARVRRSQSISSGGRV